VGYTQQEKELLSLACPALALPMLAANAPEHEYVFRAWVHGYDFHPGDLNYLRASLQLTGGLPGRNFIDRSIRERMAAEKPTVVN